MKTQENQPEGLDDKRGDGRRSGEARLPGQRHAVLGDVGDLRFGRRARQLVLIVALRDHQAARFYTQGERGG